MCICFIHRYRSNEFSVLPYPGIELVTSREPDIFLINTLIQQDISAQGSRVPYAWKAE